ncbi:FecR domain-containing protein [Ectopseudomonas mendocina]|uniref:FecR domain-containing protein n=1 Tax=Ectopseudomonas mendocina TaxID=300 RepID=UPI0005AB74CC|nr:FecR domain-containing protein [Pseudomonas mendocina]VEE16065.1 anti-FecI sigma factor FecR [Pseudomonas mendocina]
MKAILAEAVDWHVRLNNSQADASIEHEWQAWLHADSRHVEAWQRLQQLQQRLAVTSPQLAVAALQGARQGRRQALKVLGLLLGVGVVGWQGYRASPLSADYVTRVGERRRVRLADGSRLELNTDTRVDVRFNVAERLIHLQQGEILVQTEQDARPLRVQTGEGLIRALGTRFVVRQLDRATEVSVEEHAVEVQPHLAAATITRVEAGQRLTFSAWQTGIIQAASNASAWTQGMLVAVDWRLDRLLGELSRYRHGYLGCAPEVAALRLSGAFPLDDDEAVLDSLQDALPITVRRRTRYWVRIEKREA